MNIVKEKTKANFMKHLGLITALIVVFVLGSCSSQKFHTTRIQSIDFGQYKTYGWLPPVDSLSKDYFNNDIAKHNILSTANQEIEARGLKYSKENPDILFRYIAIVNNRSKTLYAHSNYWGGPWGWYSPYTWYGYYGGNIPIGKERIRYGHIIIEAIDKNKNTVIWQARGTQEVNSPERIINNLPKMITGILNEYPVKPLKK